MRTGDGPGRFVWEGSYCSRPEPTENGLIGEDWGRAWEVCVGGPTAADQSPPYCSRPEPTENGLIGEDWGRAWEVCVGGVLLQPTRAHRERSDR